MYEQDIPCIEREREREREGGRGGVLRGHVDTAFLFHSRRERDNVDSSSVLASRGRLNGCLGNRRASARRRRGGILTRREQHAACTHTAHSLTHSMLIARARLKSSMVIVSLESQSLGPLFNFSSQTGFRTARRGAASAQSSERFHRIPARFKESSDSISSIPQESEISKSKKKMRLDLRESEKSREC